MGHELFWGDYERARARRDTRTLQEIELKCDGIAVLTLMGLSLDETMLMSGTRKLMRFNETLGATANTDAYPKLDVRARFVRDVAALREVPGTRGSADHGSQPARGESRLPHRRRTKRLLQRVPWVAWHSSLARMSSDAWLEIRYSSSLKD
jgi:hypothetical protein